MIKKVSFAVLLTLLLLVLSLFFIKYNFHLEKAEAPKKPKNVPISAVWKGDFDEGFWIDLVNVDSFKKEYRYKIYTDIDGALAFDGLFSFNKNCLKSSINENPDIIYFEHIEQFSLIINDNCSLDAIFPAFGGKYWKVKSN